MRLFRVQEVQGSNPCGPNEVRAAKTTFRGAANEDGRGQVKGGQSLRPESVYEAKPGSPNFSFTITITFTSSKWRKSLRPESVYEAKPASPNFSFTITFMFTGIFKSGAPILNVIVIVNVNEKFEGTWFSAKIS